MSEYRAQSGRAPAADPQHRIERRASSVPLPARSPDREAPPSLPFELAAFQHLIDPALLAAAAQRAARLNVGGDEVLRCHDVVSADLMARTLAKRLGLEIDPLDDDLPPRSARLLEAACTGVLARVAPGGRTILTVAPRGYGIRRLADALANDPQLCSHLRMAAPERLSEHVRRIGATELAREAVLGLISKQPEFSAASRGHQGLRRFAFVLGGAVLAALVHPFFLTFVISDAAGGSFLSPSQTGGETFRKWLALTTLSAGYVGSAVLGLVGLWRRGLLGIAWVLATIPFYWVLLSLAAWRAVIQLLTAPHVWEKTEHGLAKSTRHFGATAPAASGRPLVKAAAEGRPRPRPPSAAG